MFERPDIGERAVLVHVHFYRGDEESDLAELRELALSAGATVVAEIEASRPSPDAKLFVGTGKADEISQCIKLHEASLVIFDHTLSPGQERNLEKLLQCRVLSRTGLILDIFAQRAHTFEGKLQVELAQLQYMSTRLVRGWTHLESQKGGIGLRGPGETQLELDKRLIKDRLKLIKKRLEKVRGQRKLGRQARKRSLIPTVSIVGYTNAGKSTLFNRLTGSNVYAANQLFATLDPTLRQIQVPQLGKVILADTVGFIRNLPHDLVEAFRATLEETVEADLLLHVIDASNPEKDLYQAQVEAVLGQIGALEHPCLKVLNKIDLMEARSPKIDLDESGKPDQVWLSAHTGQGMDFLLSAIAQLLMQSTLQGVIKLKPQYAKLRAALYQQKCVIEESIDEEGCSELTIKIPAADLTEICRKEGLELEQIFSSTNLS
ncbi:MAG: putative GTP-binding protein [Gammaproteobacteria bacterium]|nr:putative GTP-binding protein [Gammaproteobacteria bacterium]